jgi:hypothetical protein
MSTLANDSKDCALPAPRSHTEESQQPFNSKTEHDNRTHLTPWQDCTKPSYIWERGSLAAWARVCQLKEKVWCTHWVLTDVTKLTGFKVIVLPPLYLGLARAYLPSRHREMLYFAHRSTPARARCISRCVRSLSSDTFGRGDVQVLEAKAVSWEQIEKPLRYCQSVEDQHRQRRRGWSRRSSYHRGCAEEIPEAPDSLLITSRGADYSQRLVGTLI